jgi:hypothetical protein
MQIGCGKKVRARFTLAMMAIIGLMSAVGCDSGTKSGGGLATYAKEGVTFQLPPGWVQEDVLHYQTGHKDENYGLVMVLPLKGRSLDAYVTAAAKQSGDVAGRRAFEVNGHDAVELLLKSEYSVFEAYIQRGDEAVYLSFRTLPEAFNNQLAAFRTAAQSVRFQ